MSPFSDLPSLPGCGRCGCGAPEVPLYGGAEYRCYASGSYDCNAGWRRQISPRTPGPFPEWCAGPEYAQETRERVARVRRAYWRELGSSHDVSALGGSMGLLWGFLGGFCSAP